MDDTVTGANSPLVFGPDGNLYGACYTIHTGHDGIIFRVAPDGGELTVLYEFAKSPARSPMGLTLGSDGLLYGVARWSQQDYNFGFVYRMTLDGEVTFLQGPLPWSPDGPLLEASDGNWYGTAGEEWFGGPHKVFRMPEGQLFGPTQATKPKNRYRNGTLFSIHRQSGKLKTLFDFPHPPKDGKGPVPLVRRRDGFYYGATAGDGKNSAGTLLRMTPEGVVKTLFRFNTFGDTSAGGAPYVRLTEGANGEFYGLTRTGGANQHGTLFRMKVMA